MSKLHFTHPFSSLLFICLAALLGGFFLYLRHRKKLLRQFASDKSLLELISGYSNKRLALHTTCFSLASIFLIFALMGPYTKEKSLASLGDENKDRLVEEKISDNVDSIEPVRKKRRMHDVIFLVDTSLSMSIADTRPGKPRLAYACVNSSARK